METMPLTHGRNAREKPGNGTTLAKRQGSPRRSERRSLSISCCILSRWPMATGQALPVQRHLECAVPVPKNGHMGIWAYGHMQKNMAKWGIPEKRIKNAAQRCYSEVPRTLQSKVMAKCRFWGISPCISP